MAEKTNTGLVEYARVQAEKNRPYWFATFGQEATPELLAYKTMQNADMYNKWPKESFTSQFGQKVHDCSGLIKGYMFCNDPDDMHPVYNSKYDYSANGMIDICKEQGDIGSIPEVQGLIVWKNNHVGIYAGGGQIIEARGHSYGVIFSRIQDTAWKKWGRLPFIEYKKEPEPVPEPQDTCQPTAPVLTQGMKCNSVKRLQAVLNTWGADLKIDGSFGPKTAEAVKDIQKKLYPKCGEPDGVVGTRTWSELLK